MKYQLLDTTFLEDVFLLTTRVKLLSHNDAIVVVDNESTSNAASDSHLSFLCSGVGASTSSSFRFFFFVFSFIIFAPLVLVTVFVFPVCGAGPIPRRPL